MLQLYDLYKVKISNLTLYKDLKLQSVLSTGDKTLSFSYPSRSSDEIKEEGYIRTKTHEFVIKEISTNGDWKSIQAVLNVEDLEGKTWEHFDTPNQTITDCLILALAGTGWMIGYCNETKKRTISKTNCSTWDIIQEIKKTYFVEMEFDTLNKRINIAKNLGNDKGVYFIDSLNLKDLDVKSNSYDFCTRLIAIGKDDLKVTVENYQYSSKKKTIIWKDEKYTDESSLREDAIAKLEELSKPYKSYGADIVDLASINDKYSILSYGLGDIITLISKEEGIKEKQRIVKMVEYPDEPDKNTCEIANTVLTFEDMQKEYEDTSKTVNNITSSNGTISEGAIKGTVEKITVKKADIESLNAVKIRVGDLEATSATITQLDAVDANIKELKASKADIGELKAGVGRIDILESSVGDIKTLVNGNLTSSNIHSLILTSDKVTVDNGFIKNAMIDNLDVSKIKAGDISTNKFKIKSDNGGIEITGATQQFKDKNNRVRIQMGQDTKGDFNFILRGEDGTTTLMDHTGITGNAIADDLIKGNMISENAVGGKQIDYNSFTKEFNKDTNTHTLKSSKVLLDKTNQTLNVAFDRLDTKVDSAPPKVTTEESITKLDGAIDGMLKLNSIKGRTLQNLFLGSKLNFTWTASGSNRLYAIDISNSSMNKSTMYTVCNLINKKIGYDINHKDTNGYIKNFYVDAYSKKTITLTENEKLYVITALESDGWSNTQTDKDILKQSTLILEGDYTNKPIPSYFEGIRSVGETTNNNIPLPGIIENQEYLVTRNSTDKELELTDYIEIDINKKYFLSAYVKDETPYTDTLGNGILRLNIYDGNKVQISNQGIKGDVTKGYTRLFSDSITFPSNAHYIMVYFRHMYGSTGTVKNIKLEEDCIVDSGLEAISCGKNLCNNKWEIGSLSSLDGTDYPSPEQATSQYLPIGGNKTYTLGISNSELYNNIFYILYNANKKVVGKGGWITSSTVNILSPNECRYIRILVKNKTATNINILTPPIIQLEEGTIFTQYEPYQEHRQPIDLTEPLRRLPNGVKDTINKDVVARNVGKIVFNGNEVWHDNGTGDERYTLFYNLDFKNTFAISDKFSFGGFTISPLNSSEGIFGNSTAFYLSILNSKTGIIKTETRPEKIAKLKAWLQANPTTVYYQLATPVETPIKVEQYMKQFKDGYFITDGSLINPEVEFEYSTSLASATSMMKEVTESNSTYLNVQQGKIDALISNTTITKDGQTIQLKDSYNSTVATVDSINNIIGEHASTIDDLTGEVTGVSDRTNEVKRTLDGTVSTVSAHTASISGLNSTVSTQENSIKQLKDSISLKVSKEDVTNTVNGAIDNISVGGRNLWINKNVGSYKSGNVSNLVGTSYDNYTFTVTSNPSDLIGCRIENLGETLVVKGKTKLKSLVTYYKFNNGIQLNNTIPVINGEFEYTIKVPSGADYLNLGIGQYPYISGYTLSEIQVETGNKATNWTPAPEDVEDSIKTVLNKAAAIEINVGKITSRVSSVEQTTNTLDGNLTGLDTRLKTAENKITDSAIISTVSSTINTAKNDAIELAKAISEGKMLYTDSTFTKGNNGLSVYNNSGVAHVTLTRIAKPSDCPTTSTHCMEIKTIGITTNPGLGGCYFGNQTRANAIFVLKMIAKIPSGSKLTFGSNSYGSGGSAKWLTSNVGTGKWEEYIHKVTCGSSGSFSTTNYFYIDKGNLPFTWQIASASIYDVTDTTDLNIRIESAEQKITEDAIISSVNTALGSGKSISTVSTTLDRNGFTIYNGALTIKNKAGTTVLSGDTNGDITINGRLQPSDSQIKLFGNECKIDGSANAIRLQYAANTYISVDRVGALRLFNSASLGGTRYVSLHYESDGHAKLYNDRTMLKLLSGATPQVQARNTGDNAYCSIASSEFINASSQEFKTNIEDIDIIKARNILKENSIKEYNLKQDIALKIENMGLENQVALEDIEYSGAEANVSKKIGLILEHLSEDGKEYLNPEGTDGIDLYSMCSILWKVVQEQQTRIEKLEALDIN